MYVRIFAILSVLREIIKNVAIFSLSLGADKTNNMCSHLCSP